MGDPKTMASAAVDGLRGQVAGSVLLAEDPGYDEARRVWNGMIDRRPAAVVRAASPADIAPTVRYAREHALPLAVRGGGHNVAGNGTVEGGIVLDLGGLKAVQVDEERGTVRAQAGATLGDIDRATGPHNLAVPVGVVSGTGVAGLTLGGGVGWLTRAHGLTIDNLLSAELVTASGEVLRASAGENPELFWGLRGGGGNFGVVSSFTFRAHPLPSKVFSGNLVYRRDGWADALRVYDTWTRDLPDEMTSIVSFFVPPETWELGGDPHMLLGFVWASPDAEEGERIVDRLRTAAPPDTEVAPPARWAEWQSAADEMFPKGVRGYWKNTSFDRLDDDVIGTLVRRGTEQTWRGTGFDIHHLGGAFGRVPEDATPFPNRSARFWLNVYGYWPDAADDAPHTAFVRGMAADMEPYSTGGQYVNFLGEERGRDPVAQALSVYGPEKLQRLAALKREFDPENIFRLNHNIPLI
ncbi:FAD/FMN-containing dehydrogenase [Cryobacterium psychrotolerans]|uniref:FAD/FMN-containing dehydrogenase n=1 Tax=Cryobacterium psychrotolerans TaxID=386301 RepID=A0A1G9F9D5_9MICO|nr:FAD-binding oxidoreductase [Cryobacterium psychrotolerans]TFD86516.1 FAD-binding oxidoreductase [Cryobacterium psychrotolerans]SDK84980.1 FAD/FMN-containing dehydrogenase [Cryobacterium psychrotolerans]